jgi:polyphosphate:AMP phosphotransferase
MFEAAELGRKTSKKDYQAQLPELRAKLLDAQLALKKSNVPVIIIISGVDGAGKGEVVHCLNEWLDPRGIDTQAFWQSSDEEIERPAYWRFWRVIPSRGRIGIFFGSWYTEPITDRVYGKIKNADLDASLKRIAFFERMLVEDGTLLIKLWLHLSKKAQFERLIDLQKNPETHWRVLPTDWKHHKLYDKFAKTSERVIRQTDTGKAPWCLVEATDSYYRDLTVGRLLLESLQQEPAVAAPESPRLPKQISKSAAPKKSSVTILDHVNLNESLSEEKYRAKLAKYQAKLNRLVWKANKRMISSVVVFEGWDASGKGSGIRRVTEAIDPRLYRLIPIAAPTDEERAHHYLWRFWRHLPRAGMFTIFDRSWYGRVLVERVERLAKPEEWMRAYLEINDFEEQLAEHGIVVTKFWIHISKDEQLRRFKKREEIAYKRYKITEEDWRNRQKWDAYKSAVNDMIARTSTEYAPWTLIAGNDKKTARIQILKTLCQHLEQAV